jgi:hypothetical protein
MELSEYLSTESVIGLTAPRWIKASVIADVVSQYLDGKGYWVHTVTSSSIHDEHRVPTRVDAPVVNVYASLLAALSHFPSKNIVSILVLEWGFDYTLLETIARKTSGIRYLRLTFLHEPRSVRFNTVRVPITADYATWYNELTKVTTSHDVKGMAGNHYYRSMTPQESVHAMVNAGKYTYHPNSLVPEASGHVSHVGMLGPEGTPYPPSTGSFAVDSPKLHAVIDTLSHAAGKVLIVTSYRFAFGMTLFQKILAGVFGRAPFIIDPSTTAEHMESTIKQFNSESTGVLVTSTIPTTPLLGVERVFVMDDYNPMYILQTVYNVCTYRCGALHVPLNVTLLTVSVPSFIAENTYEETQAAKCLSILEVMGKRYDAIESISIPVVIDNTNFKVLDVEVIA